MPEATNQPSNGKVTYVATLATGEHSKISEITFPLLSHWANKWGCEFSRRTKLIDPDRNPSWNKIAMIQDLFRNHQCDRVIWLDADVLILNMDVNPDDLFSWYRMSVSSDFNGPCLGAFSVPNTHWGRSLMDTMWFLYQTKTPKPYDTRDTWEQNTFKVLKDKFAVIDNMVSLLNSRTTIINRDFRWSDGMKIIPFAYHAWANRGVDVVCKELDEIRRNPEKWVKNKK